MSARPRGPEVYARELERAMSRVRQRPVVLSPRDWELVVDWHARQIPLAVIQEALDEAAARARKRGSSGPRSLSYLARTVDEAWDLIRGGRLDPLDAAIPGSPSMAEVREVWSRARESAGKETPLAALIEELLRRLDDGEAPEDVERRLEGSIVDHAPPELAERIRAEVGAELAPFSGRIPPADLEATSRRAVVTRLRRFLGLPRLPVAASPSETRSSTT
jgi:hypothetical protein